MKSEVISHEIISDYLISKSNHWRRVSALSTQKPLSDFPWYLKPRSTVFEAKDRSFRG